MEAPFGGYESEGDGRLSLLVRDDLQDIKKSLTVIRDQVFLGLKRVEEAILSLEQSKCLGCEGMGLKATSWLKPKKKKFRMINKPQSGLLGPKPNKAQAWVAQSPGSSSSFPYRLLSRHSGKQTNQAGESSEMGAARSTGVNETMIAGVISGEQSPGVEVLESVTQILARGADMAGGLDGGAGRGEVVLESAEVLGFELLAPVRSLKVTDSSTTMLSTIPESGEGPGCETSTLENGPKRLSDHPEYAGEEGIDGLLPVEQSKQLKVFHRRERPLSKVTKSWVAERVSWFGGRGCDEATKEDTVWLESEELAENGVSMLGEFEEFGSMGGTGNQEEDLTSPASKDLKLVWNLKGIAGISCDGQEGKLKEIFGQIVVDKYGEGASSSTRGEVDGNLGMRDVDSFYEA